MPTVKENGEFQPRKRPLLSVVQRERGRYARLIQDSLFLISLNKATSEDSLFFFFSSALPYLFTAFPTKKKHHNNNNEEEHLQQQQQAWETRPPPQTAADLWRRTRKRKELSDNYRFPEQPALHFKQAGKKRGEEHKEREDTKNHLINISRRRRQEKRAPAIKYFMEQ